MKWFPSASPYYRLLCRCDELISTINDRFEPPSSHGRHACSMHSPPRSTSSPRHNCLIMTSHRTWMPRLAHDSDPRLIRKAPSQWKWVLMVVVVEVREFLLFQVLSLVPASASQDSLYALFIIGIIILRLCFSLSPFIKNALDGVAAAEGRVLFLTTNHIEKLDPALIRPGRVDMRSYFGLADTDQLRGLFLQVICCWFIFYFLFYLYSSSFQFYPNEKALAERFARDVPPSKISMAALQGHFLAHKKSPKAALDNVLALVSDKAAPRTRDENEEAKDESPSLRLWRKKSL